MLIVDASVFVAIALDHPSRDLVGRELRGQRLVAPELIDAEVANALKRHERSGRLERARATTFVRSLAHAPIRRVSHRLLLQDAWDARHQLSTYDAFYVALARRLGVPVITHDRRWAAAGDLGITVITVG